MPSDSDVNSYNETLCDVQSISSHYCKLGTVSFAGDFNAQIDTDTRLHPNQKSTILSAFIKRNGLSSLHEIFDSNAFTYVTARSRIDHVFIERSLSYSTQLLRMLVSRMTGRPVSLSRSIKARVRKSLILRVTVRHLVDPGYILIVRNGHLQ